jgi:hypothetical protein
MLAPEAAPFIYFDAAATYGVVAGVIQVELTANMLLPGEHGAIGAKAVMTAHLRCSPAAAMALRDALNGTLEALALAAAPPAEKPGGKFN